MIERRLAALRTIEAIRMFAASHDGKLPAALGDIKEVPVPAREFVMNQARLEQLGITARELEILELIARGMSNREIAEKLFVSENTVKTHSSRLFDKLSAKRRTQAVQIAKEMQLIP